MHPLCLLACDSEEAAPEAQQSPETAAETSPAEPAPAEEPPSAATPESGNGNDVEIVLTDKLDGVTNHYCIDIAGGNRDIDTANGLQTHTCYSYQGSLGDDQVFDASRFASNVLFMPRYDVCATLAALTAGSAVGLATCDGSDLQALTFDEEGRIHPVSAPEMCITAGQPTRFGRSETHQIKALS